MRAVILLVVPAMFLSMPAFAEKSVLFKDQGNEEASKFTEPAATNNSEQQAHCDQLLKDIEELKGRPLRRSEAQQRFDAECRPNR